MKTKNKSAVNLCMPCYQTLWCNVGELDKGLYCTTDYRDIGQMMVLVYLASLPSLYVRPHGCLCFCSGQTSGSQSVTDPSMMSPSAHAGSLSLQ